MPDGQVKYAFSGADVIEPLSETAINGWIGKRVQIHFEGLIHCVVSGKRIKKTYGEGMSYDAFLKSPLACPSIIRPELRGFTKALPCATRRGTCQPLAAAWCTSAKHRTQSGVTRATNVPSRGWTKVHAAPSWPTPLQTIGRGDGGGTQRNFSDRTHWRNMLTSATWMRRHWSKPKKKPSMPWESPTKPSLKIRCVTRLHYPVHTYPSKVTSVKLDKHPDVEGTLVGIKGQYWLFEDGRMEFVHTRAIGSLWQSIERRIVGRIGDVRESVSHVRNQTFPERSFSSSVLMMSVCEASATNQDRLRISS